MALSLIRNTCSGDLPHLRRSLSLSTLSQGSRPGLTSRRASGAVSSLVYCLLIGREKRLQPFQRFLFQSFGLQHKLLSWTAALHKPSTSIPGPVGFFPNIALD